MKSELHIFWWSIRWNDSESRREKLVRLATSDAYGHIGKILMVLRREGMENELSENDIWMIVQWFTWQIVEARGYEIDKREALSLLEQIRTKRRALETFGLK